MENISPESRLMPKRICLETLRPLHGIGEETLAYASLTTEQVVFLNKLNVCKSLVVSQCEYPAQIWSRLVS